MSLYDDKTESSNLSPSLIAPYLTVAVWAISIFYSLFVLEFKDLNDYLICFLNIFFCSLLYFSITKKNIWIPNSLLCYLVISFISHFFDDFKIFFLLISLLFSQIFSALISANILKISHYRAYEFAYLLSPVLIILIHSYSMYARDELKKPRNLFLSLIGSILIFSLLLLGKTYLFSETKNNSLDKEVLQSDSKSYSFNDEVKLTDPKAKNAYKDFRGSYLIVLGKLSAYEIAYPNLPPSIREDILEKIANNMGTINLEMDKFKYGINDANLEINNIVEQNGVTKSLGKQSLVDALLSIEWLMKQHINQNNILNKLRADINSNPNEAVNTLLNISNN